MLNMVGEEGGYNNIETECVRHLLGDDWLLKVRREI